MPCTRLVCPPPSSDSVTERSTASKSASLKFRSCQMGSLNWPTFTPRDCRRSDRPSTHPAGRTDCALVVLELHEIGDVLAEVPVEGQTSPGEIESIFGFVAGEDTTLPLVGDNSVAVVVILRKSSTMPGCSEKRLSSLRMTKPTAGSYPLVKRKALNDDWLVFGL